MPCNNAENIAALRRRLDADRTIDQKELLQLENLYGSSDACLACYLRDGFVQHDFDKAMNRIRSTLNHRREHQLEERRDNLMAAIRQHPVHASWPAAYPENLFTADGCPVAYTRLACVDLPRTSQFPHADYAHFVALWYERSLQLFGQSTRSRGTTCKGSYEVYDCIGVHWRKLIYDFKAHRPTIQTLFDLAAHCPDGLVKCYIINAPSLFSAAWRLVRPFVSERANAKVTISRGVPAELTQALGGEAGVRAMTESVPKPK